MTNTFSQPVLPVGASQPQGNITDFSIGAKTAQQLEEQRQREAQEALKGLSLPTKTVGVKDIGIQQANLANFALEAGGVRGVKLPAPQIDTRPAPVIQRIDLPVEPYSQEPSSESGDGGHQGETGYFIGTPWFNVPGSQQVLGKDNPEVNVKSENLEKLELPTQPQSLPADEAEIAKKEEKRKKLKKWSWITAGVLVVIVALIVIVKMAKKKK